MTYSQALPSLSLSCPWLHYTHMTRLEQRLMDIREEQGGGVILFTWLSFLQEDSLTFLGMEKVIRVSELCEVEQTEAASESVEENKNDVQASGSSVQNTCDKIYEELAVELPVEKIVPSEKNQLQRRYSSVRTLVGTVKKWKQLDDKNGHGFIKMSDGREFSFHSRDCQHTNDSERLISFRKGEEVTFEEQKITAKKHHSTPKAVNVAHANYYQDDMNGMKNELSRVANEIGSDKHNVKLSDNQEMQILTEQVPTKKDENSNHALQMQRKKVSRRQKLLTLFREFDQMKKEEVFSSSLQSCDICFIDKVGSQCVKFVGCDHVYCRDCMSGYLNVRIKEGNVSNLMCPTDKCTSQILPTQVSELVSAELYERYERILLETQLETMVDVVLCPRLACQCPTMIDREQNMGQCPACQFAFCIYCRQTYHGVSPCKMRSQEQRAIIDKYSSSSGDEKVFLEKKFGKKRLELMASTLASEDYVKSNARQCPHCNAPIEKNDGCNKITCWRCGTNFCWLCGKRLDKVNPYAHFNIIGGDCFGALFHGVVEEEEEQFNAFGEDDEGWEQFVFGL